MAKPEIAQKSPYQVTLVAGKKYWWCACGRSKKQPYCDGSHAGTEFTPVEFTAAASDTAWLCGCKQTASKPRCDGTHSKI